MQKLKRRQATDRFYNAHTYMTGHDFLLIYMLFNFTEDPTVNHFW